VPDTVDGRFDMIVLHTGLTARRLREAEKGSVPAIVAQEMLDHMIVDFDRSLREMGVGDLSVPRHIKKMGKAWFGRATLYDEGIDAAAAGNLNVLQDALRATLYRTRPESPHVAAMAQYILRADAHLKTQALATIGAGDIDWSVSADGQ
jgi:cytochrome b pre-mRNA-processing protein 3